MRRYAVDAAVALLLVALAWFEVLSSDRWHSPAPVSLLIAVAATVPIAFIRARPLPATLILLAAIVVECLLFTTPQSLAIFFSQLGASFTYFVATDQRRREMLAALTISVAVIVWRDQTTSNGYDVIFEFGLLVPLPAFVGAAVRNYAGRATIAERHAEQMEELARQAVAEERARIARELHDVVAHGISMIVVQAAGGRAALDHRPDRARGAFDAIEATGQQAMSEMRRLLQLLRANDEELLLVPQPGLAQLDQLLARAREAGLDVVSSVQGAPVTLMPGVDLAAYRIVQEALTNALRHAGPARARVSVTYQPDRVDLEIVNEDGTGGRGQTADVGGYGVAGMRERATLYGGTLDANPRDGGGYVVRASLPIA